MRIGRSLFAIIIASCILIYMSGCAMMPGGIAASTTPIDGRKYSNLVNTLSVKDAIDCRCNDSADNQIEVH